MKLVTILACGLMACSSQPAPKLVVAHSAPAHASAAPPEPKDNAVSTEALESPRLGSPSESHARMIRTLATIRDAIDSNNSLLGKDYLDSIRKSVASLPPETGPRETLMMRVMLSMMELRHGNHHSAVQIIEEGIGALGDNDEGDAYLARTYGLFYLGVAWIRTGEVQNCCARETPDSCIAPIRGGGLHDNPKGSSSAIEHFLRVLDRTSSSDRVHWQARWLLNIAYMTLDKYPTDVPEKWLLPPSSFASEDSWREFASVGASAGVNRSDLGGGVAADDFDGDGLIDLVVSSRHPATPLAFYRNSGDGKFKERGEAAGFSGILGGNNIVHADFNNDGLADIFVTRGAWLASQGRIPNSLLKNLGGGRFEDVSFAAGTAEPAFPTQSAAWGDYDFDGWLDLYVANEVQAGDQGYPSQLFRNNGDGTFTDMAAIAGVENKRYAKAAVFGDFDDDGDPDIFVSNFGAANRLYRNNGDGTFTDIARTAGVEGPHSSSVAWWWDYDNDGILDLFVGAYEASVADLAAHAVGTPLRSLELPGIFRGQVHGGFAQRAQETKLARPLAPMAGQFGDLDNDGYLDFYLGTGHPMFEELMPNRLFKNSAGKHFSCVTTRARMGHLQKGEAVAMADFDQDGDLDVFESMGGAFPDDTFVDILYRNPGAAGGFLVVELQGTKSNRSAIGARIRITTVHAGQRRTQTREVSTGGSAGANPLRQHFGLADADNIETVEIRWPGQEAFVNLGAVAPNQHIRVVENKPGFESIAQRTFELGPAND